MSSEKKEFHAADYGLFGVSLALSVGIGVFYAIKDRKKRNTEEIFLAGRSMTAIPIALSLLASFQSAISIIGVPAEIYFFGTMYVYFCLGALITPFFCNYIFVPIFYNLRITSAYEYLSLRFNMAVRVLTAILFCIQMLLFMAVALYAPALSLSAVTGLPLWPVTMTVGVVCVIYTTIGGMKAVVWTDSLQMLVIIAGLIAVLIRASIDLGGFTGAWTKAEEGGRVVFNDFSFDPTVRHSFWSLVVGGWFTTMAIYGTNQATIQRACCLPTLAKARLAYWLSVPGFCLSTLLYMLIGIAMFAYYSDCDPIVSKKIEKPDQIVPYFVMDVLGDYHGLPGLFMACLFSGALSTVSSGINALAAVALQDLISPFVPKMRERTASILGVGLVLGFGILCLALTYVASFLGGIYQTVLSLFGIIGGPILGVFTLGMLFPWANSWGALSSLVVSLAYSLWIGVASQILPRIDPEPRLPLGFQCLIPPPCSYLTASNCSASAMPVSLQNATTPSPASDEEVEYGLPHYYVSYQYYSFQAVLISIIVGMLVSGLTGFTKPSTLNPDLFCPFFEVFCPCLPENVKRFLRCGVREKPDEREDMPPGKVYSAEMETPFPEISEQYRKPNTSTEKAELEKPRRHPKLTESYRKIDDDIPHDKRAEKKWENQGYEKY